MTITPRLNKLLLTTHIVFSVGWLGAVAVFLALAITGLTSQNILMARSCFLAMELTTWIIIVPFCLTTLFTGIIQAVITKWGLLNHYWIVVKLFLTIVSTLLLFLHIEPIEYMAHTAADPSFSNSQHFQQIINLIAKAGAAVLVLVVITTISVYKPWGRINNAWMDYRKQQTPNQNKFAIMKKSGKFYLLIVLVILIALIIIKHIFGGGMGHH